MEQVTNEEILTAINDFASKVEERFGEVNERMDKRFDKIEGRVGHLENQMVTKDYLDQKLADRHGSAVFMIRREDEKVDTLVNKLREEDSLSVASAQAVLEIKPMARA